MNPGLSLADTSTVLAYNEKESQIVERIRSGALRLDPDLLWLILHFVNNRLQLMTLPILSLERHSENLTPMQKEKIELIKKKVFEIEAFLKELGELAPKS